MDRRNYHTKVTLSPREKEVLQYIASGWLSLEIANKLFLSEHTVRNFVKNACAKLNARGRAHAVVVAAQRGELDLSALLPLPEEQ